MKLKLKLLKPFSDAVGKSELEIDFDGSNLEDLLRTLTDNYSGLKKEFYTESGELTNYIVIFVNDKPISALKELDTELKDGDEILFFVPVSGG